VSSEDDFWRFKDDLDEACDLWFITRNRLMIERSLSFEAASAEGEIAVQRQFHVNFKAEDAYKWLKQYPRHPINNPVNPPKPNQIL
jgi:hypothetical protein